MYFSISSTNVVSHVCLRLRGSDPYGLYRHLHSQVHTLTQKHKHTFFLIKSFKNSSKKAINICFESPVFMTSQLGIYFY